MTQNYYLSGEHIEKLKETSEAISNTNNKLNIDDINLDSNDTSKNFHFENNMNSKIYEIENATNVVNEPSNYFSKHFYIIY